MKTAEKWVEESLRCGGMFDNVRLDDAEALVEAIQKDALNTDARTDEEKAAGSRRLAMMVLNRTPFRLKLVQDFSQEDGLMFSIEQDLHGEPFEVTTLEKKEAPKEAPEGEGMSEKEDYFVADSRQSAYSLQSEDRFDDAHEAMKEADKRGQDWVVVASDGCLITKADHSCSNWTPKDAAKESSPKEASKGDE